MSDDDLLRAIRASAKRGREAKVRPLDTRAREKIADAIVRSYPPARARRRRTIAARGAAVVGAIAFAAIVFFVLRPSPRTSLPSYELVASGGASDMRGPSPSSVSELHLRKGDRFEIVLRPLRANVDGVIAARAFLVRGDEVVPYIGTIDIAHEGAIHIEGDRDDFRGATQGAWTLVIAIGPPTAIAGDAAGFIREERGIGDGLGRQVKRIPLILE